ncbi:MFS transporter [Actinorugispora endophytica]|uniref:Putative MFS family arabinose efflux permease n=1 Tax=Actinorugispora endophytica TaxID=1605990 RepID=A0A4R6V2W4_9ACTN|nr:MFS transporter [Actinorugispora endophytica]TDQ54333.1 putative MFS family arabinose efflux permease [Actinorugispora endophytica]
MIRRVWPLVVAAVSLGIDAYVLAGVLPRIADSLAATVGAIGLGVTAFTGAYAVAGPLLSGPLTAVSTRRGLLVALGVFNAGNLATALAPDLWVFLGSRVVSGTGAGVLTAVATAAAAGMVAPRERGRAMALVTFGLSAGTVAGVPAGMLVGEQAGWRWTMGLVVAVGVVSMLALAVRSRPMPPVGGGDGRTLSSIAVPQVAGGVALAFLFGLGSLGLYTYLLPMAAERGMADWGFAFVWAWGIGGVAGSALAGGPIDAVGSHRLLPLVAGLLLASFTILALLDGPAVWLVAVALWGACGWSGVPALQDALTRSRPERTTSIVAFQMAAMYLGAAVGAALGSALLGAGVSAGRLPAWAAACGVAALLLALLVVRPRRRPRTG